MEKLDENQKIAQVVERLAAKFPHIPSEHIAELVEAIHHELDGNPVRDFVPVLIEHDAKEQLRAESRSAVS